MIEIRIPEKEGDIRVYTGEMPNLKGLPEDMQGILTSILLRGTLQYLQGQKTTEP